MVQNFWVETKANFKHATHSSELFSFRFLPCTPYSTSLLSASIQRPQQPAVRLLFVVVWVLVWEIMWARTQFKGQCFRAFPASVSHTHSHTHTPSLAFFFFFICSRFPQIDYFINNNKKVINSLNFWALRPVAEWVWKCKLIQCASFQINK